MTLTHEDITKLKAPLPLEAHELREGGKDGMLVYLTEEPVADRLTEVDPNWEFAIQAVHITQNDSQPDSVTVHAVLTVCGVSRANVGTAIANSKTHDYVDGKRVKLDTPVIYPLGEMELKGAATDAIKRCARLFGVGSYLLRTKGEKFRSDADFERWYKAAFGGEPKPDRRMQTGPGTPGASTKGKRARTETAAVSADEFSADSSEFNGTACDRMKLHMATTGMAEHPTHAANIIMEAMTSYNDGNELGWSKLYGAKYPVSEVWAQVQANRAAQQEAHA